MKVIFKFILALKQWRVCTISSAITLLHLRIYSSRNYSLISLHVSTLISSIISPTNTLQVMNQFIQLTLQFLLFIPTIQLIFLNCFYIFLFFMQLHNFYHHQRVQSIEKGRRLRTTDDPKEGTRTLNQNETARVGEQLQLLPPFLDSPGRKQSEPLPTVEASELIVSS